MTIATDGIEIDVASAKPAATAWPAIIGGALAAAAISLILMVLGSGLGLSAVSPWTSVNATTVAVGSVIWLVIVQWIASGLGGYLTGRLRNRSSDPPDEAFFRDTANGFLSWALATLIVAAVLTSALSAIIGAGAQATATVAAGVAQGTGAAASSALDQNAYYVDALFRPAPAAGSGANAGAGAAATTAAGSAATAATTAAPTAPATPTAGTAGPASSPNADNMGDVRAETGRILANGLLSAQFPQADEDYLAQLVASRTGISATDAQQRVTATVQSLQTLKANAQTAADNARKAAAHLALYMFLALIVGAFIAAAAAALGGGHRDEQPDTMMR